MRGWTAAVLILLGAAGAARAQDLGAIHPRPLPPLAHPDDPSTPAKELFGRQEEPTGGAPHIYGFYAKGCLAGAQPLPMDGEAWQVMRPSRNRNWGHPWLISFLEQTATKLRREGVWPGFLVGDMAQPRGGPMRNGHASHQIGIDADVWFRPMPSHSMSRAEREETMSSNLVRADRLDVDPAKFSSADIGLLHGVASDARVERMFVNPAIKKALCRDATGDRRWLAKIRPMYGHDYHFHIRLVCPPGELGCQPQAPPPTSDGCDASLAWWFRDSVLHPRPNPNYKPRPPMTMAALPNACRAVLDAE